MLLELTKTNGNEINLDIDQIIEIKELFHNDSWGYAPNTEVIYKDKPTDRTIKHLKVMENYHSLKDKIDYERGIEE